VARRDHFISVRPYLPHAVAATAAVVVVPLAIVGGLLSVLNPDPPLLISAALGVVLALVMMVIGGALWLRRSESADIGFSDLMLWRWNRRRRAEDSLSHGARLLGLDRSGQPIDEVRISPEQQLQVLKDLTTALESKDPYTHGHSQRVERHTYRTAAAMGISEHDLDDLRKAAALHDVGKIRVPDRVLRKAGPLTDDERMIVEEHSVVGAWMVSSVGNADVIAAVRHHHEKWDGTGYPDGLEGSDIPLFARVIAVADAYDAITSTRPYRAGSGREDAILALKAGSGTQFDPEIVDEFIAALPSRIPVAAGLFLLLGGPSRLLREMAVWFRRLGAGSLTPAVGATGAAIVLGASIFTPSVVSPAAPMERRASAVTGVDNVPAVTVEVEAAQEKEPANDRVRGTRFRKRDNKPAAAKPAANNTDGSGQDAQPNQSAVQPEPQPQPQPQPEPEPDDSAGNPNDGRDGCIDGDAGKGNDKKNC
jgi:putative nucleotidyltransferase with HDIG domain